MKCIYCGCMASRVIDSRSADEGASIRRRRECEGCGKRFTTYEKVDTVPLMVVKKDRRREPFDSEKLREGIIKACEKRPISMEQIKQVVSRIEMNAYASEYSEQEITSTRLGEMVMEELRDLDEVAYIRFASVYRQFKDIQTFRDELNSLLGGQ